MSERDDRAARRWSGAEPATPVRADTLLTERQAVVLRALVASYVGQAAPVGSEALTALLPMRLSSASVRNVLAELAELGLVEKPHRSAGRVPTERGFRLYVHQLMSPRELGAYERRDLEGSLEERLGEPVARVASRLLSERTRQLGFVMAPRLDRVVLRHVSLVRVSSERILAVLLSQGGVAYQRVLLEPGHADQAELDRTATALSERVAGRTLREVREQLLREAASLRTQADLLLERTLRLAPPLPGEERDEVDLVVESWLALLEQPEFQDPQQLRAVVRALDEKQRLVGVLDHVLESGGVTVTFGEELGEPALARLALVAAPYGRPRDPQGTLGVIGPARMDYTRVVPLVEYLSRLVTERVSA
jgi:heat-inducible transcriptional repressor